MFERFSDNARQVVVRAQTEARERGHLTVTTEHLLLAMVNHNGSDAQRVLLPLGTGKQELNDRVESLLPPTTNGSTTTVAFSPEAKSALELALRSALERNSHFINSRHIVLGLLAVGGPATELLADLSCSVEYVDSVPWPADEEQHLSYEVLVEEHRKLRRQVDDLLLRVQALEAGSGSE